MKKIILVLIISFVLMQSCVTSLQPIVTHNTAILDDRLAGNWNSDGQDYTVQKFHNSDLFKELKETGKNKDDAGKPLSKKDKEDSVLFSKSYIVKYRKDTIEYYLLGSLVKLNGQFFMNFMAIDFGMNDRLATNTIARVQFNNSNTVNLDFIDGSFLYEQVKAGRLKIKNERDDLYDTFLITASTNELQQFLQKYGSDPRFFNKENSVTLTRNN